jgi:hypothetical protein
MPNKGLSIGHAVARGGKSFLDSFIRTKQMEQQEKLQKNAFVIDVLMGQLRDENIPYDQRAKILDSIPQLVGAKLDRPLSQMLQLDKFNEQIVKTKEATSGTPDTFGTKDTSSGIAITRKGTQGTEAEFQRQGELTPAIIKRKLALELKRADDEGDTEKAKKIAQIQFDLNEKSYKANGFKITSEGTDENGEYVQILTNNSGEQKVNRLPEGFKPLKLQIAETRLNKPSTFIKEREDYWESQGLSAEEANRKALEDANERYKLKQKTGEAYVTSIEQGIKGTKPLQPAQIADDIRANEQQRLTIQKDIDDNLAEATAAMNDVQELGRQKTEAGTEAAKLDQEFASTEFNATDPEYKDLVRRRQEARDRYNKLTNDYQDARRREVSARGKATAAQGRLKGVGASPVISSQIKSAVQQVRKNNPDKTKNMSDDEIINYLRSKKLIP